MTDTIYAILYFITFILFDKVFKILIIQFNLSLIVKNLLRYIIVFILPMFAYFIITKKDYKKVLRINKCKVNMFKDLNIYSFVSSSYLLGGLCSIIYTMVTKSISKHLIVINSLPLLEMFVMSVILAPMLEEILMRGIILDRLSNIPIIYASVINGIIFGLFHRNMNQFLSASFSGFAFAYLVLLTDSIYISWFFHVTGNLLATINSTFFKTEQLLNTVARFKWYVFMLIIAVIFITFKEFRISIKNLNNTYLRKD